MALGPAQGTPQASPPPNARGASAPRAPEDSSDPGGQLVRGEGLRHVVVEAGLQALYDVVLPLTGGEHDDRELGHLGVGAVPDAPGELQARHPGHQAVGDDEVRDEPVLQKAQRLLTVLGLGHIVAEAGELRDDDALHDAVVVCHEDLRTAGIQELIASLVLRHSCVAG